MVFFSKKYSSYEFYLIRAPTPKSGYDRYNPYMGGVQKLIKTQINFYPMKFTKLVFEKMTNKYTYTFCIAKRIFREQFLVFSMREATYKECRKHRH